MSHLKNTPSNVPSSVETAAVEAAVADGLITANGLYVSDEKAKKAGLRRGKWTSEEEFYANRLIYEFKLGLLPLTDGTTLRTFLSKLLNCDPMRISKKFVGQNCIGKQVFRRRQQDLEKLTPEQIELSRRELAELERKFLEKVAQTNRAKTPSSVSSAGVKDGRVDYEDENGNAIAAPWMVLPHPQTGEEAGSSFDNGHGHGNGQPDQHQLRQYDQYAQYQQQGGGRTGSAYPRYQQQQQMGRYTGTAVPAGGEEGFPRVTSLDLLNTIANLNSSSASLDNYIVDAGAIKQEQQLYHAQRAHGGGGADMQDPTPDVFPALALATNSSTFTLGEAWPSFSNFNAFGGGSMDDLTAAAANSNSAESLVQEGMYKPSSLSVDDSNSIGYPLEDGSSTVTGTASSASVSNSSSSCDDKCITVPSAHKASLSSSGLASGEAVEAVSAAAPSSSVRAAGDASSTGPLLSSAAFLQAQQQQRAQVQVRVQAPIVDVAGMSSMAHMYQPAFALPSSRSNGSISNSGADNGSGNGSGSSNVPVDNRSSESEHLLAGTMGRPHSQSAGDAVQVQQVQQMQQVHGMPKNGSVEDFWMLVNMGDLPQPEQNVLSQRVWSPMPLARAGSVGSAGFGSSSTGQQMGMNTNTISSSIGGGGGDGYYPPVPPPPPRADSSAAATTATAEGMGHGKRAEVSGGGEGADGDDGNMSKRMKH